MKSQARSTVAGAILAAAIVCLGAWPTAAGTRVAAPSGSAGSAAVSSHDRIEQIQEALRRSGAKVPVDGNWGSRTAAALRNFQKSHGLPVTGGLDPETARLLNLSGWKSAGS